MLAVRLKDDTTKQNRQQEVKIMRKLSLFIATSLDGYIAKPNDDFSFSEVS
jgi:hypothetical protein